MFDTRELLLTMDLNRLNANEQRELQGRMEKKQMKEFLTVRPFHNRVFKCLK